ncbi:MAG: hypothetical protein V2B19_29770 [Pseudomonadota bacterium]
MTENIQETRMDRLERYLEEFSREFSKGMLELKATQNRTDERLKRVDAQIQELKKPGKRTDEQCNRIGPRRTALKDDLNGTEAQLRRTILNLDKVEKQLIDKGLIPDLGAEELFYRKVKSLFYPLGMRFKRIRQNIRVKGRGNYDIVADNKTRVLVIEAKNKMNRRMVDEFMQKKLARLKTLLPEYRDSRILAGIGALAVKDDLGRYAQEAGLFVLTRTSDGGAALLNRKDFRPKEFA